MTSSGESLRRSATGGWRRRTARGLPGRPRAPSAPSTSAGQVERGGAAAHREVGGEQLVGVADDRASPGSRPLHGPTPGSAQQRRRAAPSASRPGSRASVPSATAAAHSPTHRRRSGARAPSARTAQCSALAARREQQVRSVVVAQRGAAAASPRAAASRAGGRDAGGDRHLLPQHRAHRRLDAVDGARQPDPRRRPRRSAASASSAPSTASTATRIGVQVEQPAQPRRRRARRHAGRPGAAWRGRGRRRAERSSATTAGPCGSRSVRRVRAAPRRPRRPATCALPRGARAGRAASNGVRCGRRSTSVPGGPARGTRPAPGLGAQLRSARRRTRSRTVSLNCRTLAEPGRERHVGQPERRRLDQHAARCGRAARGPAPAARRPPRR
jgi:hypothetical protein